MSGDLTTRILVNFGIGCALGFVTQRTFVWLAERAMLEKLRGRWMTAAELKAVTPGLHVFPNRAVRKFYMRGLVERGGFGDEFEYRAPLRGRAIKLPRGPK